MEKVQTRLSLADRISQIAHGSKRLASPFWELIMGFWERKIPVPIFTTHYALALLLILGVDRWLFKNLQLRGFHDFLLDHWFLYFCIVASLPFLLWGAKQTLDNLRLKAILARDFEESGLKTVRDRLPNLISIRAADDFSHCMTLKLNGLTAHEFREKRDKLAARLGVFISQVQEERTNGIVKLLYTNEPMPELVKLENPADYRNFTIPIGFGAGKKPYVISLEEVPHLLIGGSTQMGKSSFFRQAITCLYFGNTPNIKITFIDLKQGMESILFNGVKDISTISNVGSAVKVLANALADLKERAKFLAHNECQNIAQFNKKSRSTRKSFGNFKAENDLPRLVFFIDEASELFLTGKSARASESTDAKRICQTLVAQGRAVGIHLVIGTQRPDASTIDMSIKANLAGRLCFHTSDNASSMVVLDSVRAADLSNDLKGRAIWRNGAELQEVQTPFLSPETATEIFKDLKVKSRAIEPTRSETRADIAAEDDSHINESLGSVS